MNKIYAVNGDCFEKLKKIKDKSIDLIVTDPPYLHNKGGGKTHGTEGKSKIANSQMYNFDSPLDCLEFIRKNIVDNEYNDMYFNFIKLEVVPE